MLACMHGKLRKRGIGSLGEEGSETGPPAWSQRIEIGRNSICPSEQAQVSRSYFHKYIYYIKSNSSDPGPWVELGNDVAKVAMARNLANTSKELAFSYCDREKPINSGMLHEI